MLQMIFSFAMLMVLLLGFPSRAEAYLDPSTGSMVFQIVAGGVIAAAATMRLYWGRIRSMLRRERR